MLYIRRPSPVLEPFVDVFWLDVGSPLLAARERVLPTGTAQIVIGLGNSALRVFDRNPLTRCTTFQGSLISGAHTQEVIIEGSSEARLGVAFRPGGAFHFLNTPANDLQNTHVPLEDVWGGAATALRDRLQIATTTEARFSLLEQTLLLQASRPLVQHRCVPRAVSRFQQTRAPRISEVAAEIGLSLRQFREVFRREVGLSPKAFVRVQRFQGVLQALMDVQRVNWSDLALAHGYADQAHLVNEFRSLSGLTPAQYLQQRVAPGNHVPLSP